MKTINIKMALTTLSASQWLTANRATICGAVGPSGPPGPPGAPGAPGISIGLLLYNLIGNPSTSPTPPVDNILSRTPGVYPPAITPNPAYVGNPYTGYFTEVVGVGGSGDTLIAQFTTGIGVPGITYIPPGYWNFTVSAYVFRQTGATGDNTPLPTQGRPSSIYVELWQLNSLGVPLQMISTNRPNAQNFDGLSGDEIPLSLGIPTTNLNITDRLRVKYYIIGPIPSDFVAQFWTEGDSISQIITTFSPQQGPTGPTGPIGPTGPMGPTGPPAVTTGVTGQVAFFNAATTLASASGATTANGGASFSMMLDLIRLASLGAPNPIPNFTDSPGGGGNVPVVGTLVIAGYRFYFGYIWNPPVGRNLVYTYPIPFRTGSAVIVSVGGNGSGTYFTVNTGQPNLNEFDYYITSSIDGSAARLTFFAFGDA
jgi:hypothetical protein